MDSIDALLGIIVVAFVVGVMIFIFKRFYDRYKIKKQGVGVSSSGVVDNEALVETDESSDSDSSDKDIFEDTEEYEVSSKAAQLLGMVQKNNQV